MRRWWWRPFPSVPPRDLPDDVEALKAALAASRNDLAAARAQVSEDRALIAHLKLVITKLNRERFGARSERSVRLLDRLELQLEELEASATEDELAAERSGATTQVAAFVRRRPVRKPFPEHLPRERVVIPRRPFVRAVAAPTSPSSVRTSPRPWR